MIIYIKWTWNKCRYIHCICPRCINC